jgi:D-alanyl-lipoteichoic acid acyltransferase DltB (MBOAT superfamily)
MSACASLLVALLGLQLVPPFDNPWFMTSLSDYWARRWNVTTSSLLRAVVYDPIDEGRLVKQAPVQQQQKGGATSAQQQQQQQHRSSKSRQLLGMTAAFATSGFMHEIILQYVVQEYRPGYWFTFFTIQAPLCAAETALRRYLKAQGRPLPKLAAMAIPNVLMLITAKYFFFPPIEPTGLAELVVSSVAANIQRLVAAVQASVPLSMLIGQMSS